MRTGVQISLAALAVASLYPASATAQVAPPVAPSPASPAADPRQADVVPQQAVPPRPPVSLEGPVARDTPEQRQDAIPSVRANSAADAAALNGLRKEPEREADGQKDIEVTGSRLRNGDSTSIVQTITAKEIKARGVTSVEELIRTLPQSVNTIGAITNERTNGPLANRGQASVSQLGSLGVSAANLGGLGAGNTLILVNGRRMAGAAGIEDGFVNLNAIPLNAIERVEISPAGSSAVYGADAIGGVINFILKKEFTGVSLGARHEFSSNDASNSQFDAYVGKSWRSGNISVTGSYQRRSPVNNLQSGYTTNNYAAFFGGAPRFDGRSFTVGLQPGVINTPQYVFDPVTFTTTTIPRGLTVRPGLTGRPAISDFITVGADAQRDYVPELAGPKSETLSFTANFTQNITDRLQFYATGLYTRASNRQDTALAAGLSLALAPGQSYNPFPARYFDTFNRTTTVYYLPQSEIDSGEIQPGRLTNAATSWNVNAGFSYRFGAETTLNVAYTRSKSTTKSNSNILGSLVTFNNVANSTTAVECYNFMLANNRVPADQRAYLQGVFDRQCVALTSADPNKAFNPFKSQGGSGGPISDFYYRNAEEQRGSTLTNYEARLNAALGDLPAGKARFVVGAEYNDDGVNSREVNNFTGQAVSRDRYAFFGEMSVPVISRGMNIPLARMLSLNVAARNDTYKTDGAIGTVGNVPYIQGGALIFGSNTFSRTTPALGVMWEPFGNLVLRARRTKGFRAPPYTQLFSVTGTQNLTTLITNDPLYTCTTDCSRNGNGVRQYVVPSTTAPNPNLKPQTSDQRTLSAEWIGSGALGGISLRVTHNRTLIFNEYGGLQQALQAAPIATVLRIADFYPRDPVTNKIVRQQNLIFNIAGSRYESLIYEASYRFPTGFGTFEPKVTYLDNLKSQRKIFATSPVESTLGTIQGPDDYRIVGSLEWQYEQFGITLWGYHTPSYQNNYYIDQAGGRITNPVSDSKVGSYTTFDLTGRWQIMNNLQLNFAARNIFNPRAPFVVVSNRPYDTGRYNAAGRTVLFDVQFSF